MRVTKHNNGIIKQMHKMGFTDIVLEYLPYNHSFAGWAVIEAKHPILPIPDWLGFTVKSSIKHLKNKQ